VKWNSIQQEAWKFYNNGIGKVPKAFFYAQAGKWKIAVDMASGPRRKTLPYSVFREGIRKYA
jgi:hypothetical protein